MGTTRHVWVYVLASRKNGTLYIGVTSDLRRRLWDHRHGSISGFAHEYRVFLLVYFEQFQSPLPAIDRERVLKGWRRERKIALIEKTNPDWDDLAASWF